MSKIIKISEGVVVIGLDNGQLKEVRREDCEFEPTIGTEVEVFESETSTIVHKVIKNLENSTEKAINIKIDNSNNGPVNGPVFVGGKVVNKITYLLLAFFLGGLGVHKFYAGRIGAGIMYIVFCWTAIPAIIAFVEFIVAIFKKSDINGNIVV